MGDASAGNGLRLRHKLLAQTERLPTGGRLGPAARGAAAKLRAADHVDWSRVVIDSSSIRAVGSAQKPDPIPPIERAPIQMSALPATVSARSLIWGATVSTG